MVFRINKSYGSGPVELAGIWRNSFSSNKSEGKERHAKICWDLLAQQYTRTAVYRRVPFPIKREQPITPCVISNDLEIIAIWPLGNKKFYTLGYCCCMKSAVQLLILALTSVVPIMRKYHCQIVNYHVCAFCLLCYTCTYVYLRSKQYMQK